ncbi:MAG: serine hydrolase domain-containing protein, partial [Blastocatellia bacterium]
MRRTGAVCVVISLLLVQNAAAIQSPQTKKTTPPTPETKKTTPPAPAAKRRAIDAARLALISERMKSFVDRGRAAGIVTLVAHRGEIVSQNAAGLQDLATKTPMRADTIFQIASMTKPITAVGIMILVEDGMLAITDPVQKYLPNFANIQLKEAVKDKETKETESELSEIKKPSRPITIRDLMTHTSGMGGGYPEAFKDLFDKRDRPLAEAVEA